MGYFDGCREKGETLGRSLICSASVVAQLEEREVLSHCSLTVVVFRGEVTSPARVWTAPRWCRPGIALAFFPLDGCAPETQTRWDTRPGTREEFL